MKKRTYIAIDLKSFYASVECVERGLDPLNTNLVVADKSRTSKTICLAVSPSLKSFGIPGRPRLFEVETKVKQLNEERRRSTSHQILTGKSCYLDKLEKDNTLEIDYLVAPPRMSMYLNYSRDIYNTYLKYVSSEDIHVYSIDEVFIDVTDYLSTYKMNAHELALRMIRDVLNQTGVTATAGIGDNLYLCKVAMDIVAKHIPADADGVRIAELDEMSYRQKLWEHTPLTDFWRVGRGYTKRLAKYGLYTMGDIARFSLTDADRLYKEFGINAELLIDHAWGYESCTMKDIKEYKSDNKSTGIGQVLMEPYTYEKARVVLKEMIDNLCLDLSEKGLVTDHVGLYIGYDSSNDLRGYQGEVANDYYGRKVAKHAGGSVPLKQFTTSRKDIGDALLGIYEKTVDKKLRIRRININANRVKEKQMIKDAKTVTQYDLFTNIDEVEKQLDKDQKRRRKEEKLSEALIDIKNRYGKNSVLKGTNFEEGATGVERNKQIGGHHE